MSGDTFDSLGLSPWVLRQVQKLGLKSPTPIQKHCIPEILAGKDCVGAAKTGSGKTFAFALPILQKLAEDPRSYFALILTPTHELAHQISEQFAVAGQPMGCRVCVITGGTDQLYESQRLMNRPHIVVAMPGRLADHLLGCRTFSFRGLQYLVVDEADRMLAGGFDEHLKTIASFLPEKRQNLFFSATMNEISSEILPLNSEVFRWSESASVATVDTLEQRYILCADYDRDQVLVETLRRFREEHKSASVIVFTNTKKDCQLLSTTLNEVGFSNVCLHGYMRQRERVAALAKFKSSHVRTLIATDVASRGLDIPAVELVLNHRLPKFPHEYVHRVGRTARAGRNGLAISIFRFPRDLEFLAQIEETIKTKLTEMPVDQRMVERIFMQVSVTKREAEIKLDNKDFEERKSNYRRIKWLEEGLDPEDEEARFQKERKERTAARKAEALKKRRKISENPLFGDERFAKVRRKTADVEK
ncbi:probable ATP-dependent RNA helicase Dbp45A [Phlebotomus argentipes]|uniref:probable ATP-dependent RNA helicase Dbp45A n=1 Tax=Phlebotomus argentipes TaxID=94469 RepID=UPI002892D4D0|nr:probable ATP-dependent RNA helicase Dbp45A [Phlebotomus argentipes]